MIKFFGEVKNGKFRLYERDREMFLSRCSGLSDGRYYIAIKKLYTNRSQRQMKYLFGVVYKLIADHIGISVDEVHVLMKSRFLKKIVEIPTVDGIVEAEITRSLQYEGGDVTTCEMIEYIQSIRLWAIEFLGVSIPDPVRGDIDE